MLLNEIAYPNIKPPNILPLDKYEPFYAKMYKKYGNNLCFSYQYIPVVFPVSSLNLNSPAGLYGWLADVPVADIDEDIGYGSSEGGFWNRPYIFLFAVKETPNLKIIDIDHDTEDNKTYASIFKHMDKVWGHNAHMGPNPYHWTQKLKELGIGVIKGVLAVEGRQVVVMDPKNLITLGHFFNPAYPDNYKDGEIIQKAR